VGWYRLQVAGYRFQVISLKRKQTVCIPCNLELETWNLEPET